MANPKTKTPEEAFVLRVVRVSVIIALIAAVVGTLVVLNLDSVKKLSASLLASQGNYSGAVSIAESLPDEEKRLECEYQIAGHMFDNGDYSQAAQLYSQFNGYKESDERYLESSYCLADRLYLEGQYSEALSTFASLGDYSDSPERQQQVIYAMAAQAEEHGNHSQAINLYLSLGDYSDSYDKAYEVAMLIAGDEESAKAVLSFGGLSPESIDQALEITKRRADYPGTVIAAGAYHTVLLHSDGTVSACGDNSYGQCDVDSWKNIVQISAGAYHTVGLKADGTVVAAGDNTYGQCEVSGFKDIVEIACADTDTYALSSDGRVSMCGYHKYDSVTRATDVVSIYAGSYAVTVETANGTFISSHKTHQPESGSRVLALGLGTGYLVSLNPDGTLVTSFETEKSGERIAFFDAGPNGVIASDVSGRVWSHIFRTSDRIDFSDLEGVTQCAAGTEHYVFLTEDGSVLAYGDNSFGQCDTDSLGSAF